MPGTALNASPAAPNAQRYHHQLCFTEEEPEAQHSYPSNPPGLSCFPSFRGEDLKGREWPRSLRDVLKMHPNYLFPQRNGIQLLENKLEINRGPVCADTSKVDANGPWAWSSQKQCLGTLVWVNQKPICAPTLEPTPSTVSPLHRVASGGNDASSPPAAQRSSPLSPRKMENDGIG